MDKKNDILQTYWQRKEEFRLPLKEGSWEKLEAALAESPVRQRRFPLRLLTAAAIGLICIAAGLTLLFMKEKVDTETLVDVSPTEIQPKDVPVESQAADSSAVITPVQKTHLFLLVNQVDISPVEKEEIIQEETKDTKEENTEKSVREEENTKKADHPSQTKRATGPLPENNRKPYQVYREKNKNTYARWSFGVSSGAGNFSGAAGGIADYYFTSPGPGDPPPPPPEDPDDRPETKAAAGGNSGRSSNNDYYQHDMPISAGISVRRYLTQRIALESGLSYTYLHSDITYKDKTKGDQTVHYLGIPLKINWDLIQKGPFSLYLLGGGMVEYCLSARKESRPIDIDRWQYSLHGAVGVQYRVYKQFGLFVEPGVAYYINPVKDNTRETIRAVHPLTFNLQLGIRFSY